MRNSKEFDEYAGRTGRAVCNVVMTLLDLWPDLGEGCLEAHFPHNRRAVVVEGEDRFGLDRIVHPAVRGAIALLDAVLGTVPAYRDSRLEVRDGEMGSVAYFHWNPLTTGGTLLLVCGKEIRDYVAERLDLVQRGSDWDVFRGPLSGWPECKYVVAARGGGSY